MNNKNEGVFMWRTLLSFTVLLNLLACQRGLQNSVNTSNGLPAIVNGEAVSTQDVVAHSTVGIYLDFVQGPGKSLTQVCTGTLIGPHTVLTAAHCVEDKISSDPKRFRISFGTKIIKSDIDMITLPIRAVSAVRIHPQWQGANITDPKAAFYDIALLRFEGNIPEGFNIVPFAAATFAADTATELTVAGYGLVNGNPRTEAQELMKMKVNVTDWKYSDTHFFINANSNGQRVCNGDSGGPAYVQDSTGHLSVVGVTSFGNLFCSGGSYFTRVSTFSNWVQEKLQEIEAAANSDSSEDFVTFPYLTKIRVMGHEANPMACAARAKSAFTQLKVLGGPEMIFIYTRGEQCVAQAVVLSKAPSQRDQMEKIFAGHEMALSTFVANNSATYLGLSAMAFMGEKFVNCRRKETKNFAVGHWWLGAKIIGAGLKKISESSLEEKQVWLEKNFDCGDIKDLTSVRIDFEVTNAQECPLNSETVNSCYVFHGLIAYDVPLKGS
jgi:tryptase